MHHSTTGITSTLGSRKIGKIRPSDFQASVHVPAGWEFYRRRKRLTHRGYGPTGPYGPTQAMQPYERRPAYSRGERRRRITELCVGGGGAL